jgi:hypothetical protein
MGVALGVWARPGDPGAKAAPKPQAKAEAPKTPPLRIVVAESPAPLRDRMEVLPADVRSTPSAALDVAPAAPEPIVPRRAASGLMKVDTVVADEPEVPMPAVQVAPKKAEPPRAVVAEFKSDPVVVQAKAREAKAREARAAEAARVAERRLAAQKLAQQKLAQQRLAELRRAEQRLAEAKLAEHKLAAAHARRDQALADAREAKAEKARAAAKLVRAEKLERLQLAKAEAAHAKKKPDRAALAQAKADKLAVQRLTALLRLARAEAREAMKPRPVKVAAVRPAKAAPAPAPRQPVARRPVRGEGPLRYARNDCASGDAGETLACADQRLNARDRQMQQAYRNAEAAGVPASTLRQQQVRWQQARAAAAREAPWAVEDVYVARISELNDQTRDAREN